MVLILTEPELTLCYCCMDLDEILYRYSPSPEDEPHSEADIFVVLNEMSFIVFEQMNCSALGQNINLSSTMAYVFLRIISRFCTVLSKFVLSKHVFSLSFLWPLLVGPCCLSFRKQ